MPRNSDRRREPVQGSRGAEYPDATTRAALALLAALRPVVESLVREAVGPKAGDLYTCTSLPPAVSRRTFVETCRSGVIDGAVRDGRSWTCPRESWREARGHRPVAGPRLRLVQPDLEPAELAGETLARIRGRR